MAKRFIRAWYDPMILVGDSAGMAMLGYQTTLPVTMDQMVTFTAAVCRAVKYAKEVGER